MLCSLSNLKDNDLKEISMLEKEMNKTLLAFSCHNINADDLSPEELAKIQLLEKKLGISLVAVST